MARVSIEDCQKKLANRFALAMTAAHRARQLLTGNASPLIDAKNKEAVIALREIAEGLITMKKELVIPQDKIVALPGDKAPSKDAPTPPQNTDAPIADESLATEKEEVVVAGVEEDVPKEPVAQKSTKTATVTDADVEEPSPMVAVPEAQATEAKNEESAKSSKAEASTKLVAKEETGLEKSEPPVAKKVAKKITAKSTTSEKKNNASATKKGADKTPATKAKVTAAKKPAEKQAATSAETTAKKTAKATKTPAKSNVKIAPPAKTAAPAKKVAPKKAAPKKGAAKAEKASAKKPTPKKT